MLATRRAEINRVADRVRAALELEDVPVDVDDAVGRLGGEIVDADGVEAEAFIKKHRKAFRIGVKPLQSPVRRRFSIAHELGHLFLHMGYIIDPAKWTSIDEYLDSPKYRFGYSEEEYEAHEFAGAFLMPADHFRATVKENAVGSSVHLQPVADYFNVSVDAARVRGQWLGLLDWSR